MREYLPMFSIFCSFISACSAAVSTVFLWKTLRESRREHEIAILTERRNYYKTLFDKTTNFSKIFSEISLGTITPSQSQEIQKHLIGITFLVHDKKTLQILAKIANKLRKDDLKNPFVHGSVMFYDYIYKNTIFSDQQPNTLQEIITECEKLNDFVEKNFHHYENELENIYSKYL